RRRHARIGIGDVGGPGSDLARTGPVDGVYRGPDGVAGVAVGALLPKDSVAPKPAAFRLSRAASAGSHPDGRDDAGTHLERHRTPTLQACRRSNPCAFADCVSRVVRESGLGLAACTSRV